MQGVLSQQLSFSLPSFEYSDSSNIFPAGEKVKLVCSNGMSVPIFYINSRNDSGTKISFICSDRSYRVDREIQLEESQFDDDGYMNIGNILNHICSVCQFSGYNPGEFIIDGVISKMHKDEVLGKKCRNVLDDISRACAGCWTIHSDNGSEVSGNLVLAAVESGITSAITVSKYSTIYYSGTKSFGKIIAYCGDEVYDDGSSGTVFGTVEIETSFASEICTPLYNRLKNYKYKAWSCERFLLDKDYPWPMPVVKFDDTELYANYCDIYFTSTGIYARAGRNPVSEDEIGYLNKTQRDIQQRYKIGDVYNNVQINKNGLNLVFRDNVNKKTKKFGFNTASNGITEYDGVMTDKIMPTSIEKTSDRCRTVYYGDTKYTLTWDEDSLGNKTNIKYTKAST